MADSYVKFLRNIYSAITSTYFIHQSYTISYEWDDNCNNKLDMGIKYRCYAFQVLLRWVHINTK